MMRRLWSLYAMPAACGSMLKVLWRAGPVWGITRDDRLPREERVGDFDARILASPLRYEYRECERRIFRALMPWLEPKADAAFVALERLSADVPGAIPLCTQALNAWIDARAGFEKI